MIKRLGFIILVLVLVISMTSCTLGSNSMKGFFDDWIIQKDSRVAIVDKRYDTISINGDVVKIDTMLAKYFENPHDDVFLLLSDEKLYGVHSYNFVDEHYYETVDIYELDLGTEMIQILHTGRYCPRDESTENEMTSSEIYYSNRSIILYDGTCMTVLDVDTLETTRLSANEFSRPLPKYTVESIKKDSGDVDRSRLKIVCNSEERIITIDYMAQRNEYVKKLSELEAHKGVFTTIEPMKDFFYKSFVLDNQIYFLCRVLDRDGESNALMFRYDYESEALELIYLGFSSDYPSLYLIPIE